MKYREWRRARYRARTGKIILQHRQAVCGVASAQTQRAAAESYHPPCLGGFEDRCADLERAESDLAFWWWRCLLYEKKLHANKKQVERLRMNAVKQRVAGA